MQILREPISLAKVCKLTKATFGNLVKGVVDVRRELIALDGELHADEEALLLSDGSKQNDLWGINLYPDLSGDDFLEFDSMINVRPSQNNLTRGVENPRLQKKIREIVKKLIIP